MKSRSVDMPQSQLILRATTGHQSDYPLIAKTGAGHLPVSIFGSSKELLVKMTQGRVEFYHLLMRVNGLNSQAHSV